MGAIVLSLFMSLLFVFSALAGDAKKLVDMSYPFSEETMHWPTAKPFALEKVDEGITPGGFWFASYNYSASEHVGTHMDAPFHFAQGKWTVDQILLQQIIGPGVVIDVSRQAQADSDYRLQVSDIRAWERKQGRIPRGAIVLVYSSWGRYWGDPKRYFGTDAPGDTAHLHFPGVAKEAAEFLVKQRGIHAVGIDTPSIDYGPSTDFIAHQIFCGANTPIFENLASLERVPPKGATLIAAPMKIKGGTGAPLRIFALLP